VIPAPIKSARYINLATFRKNGAQVDTPVWCGEDGQSVYVFSNAHAGKVKRLKNSSKCRVAPCTVNGSLTGDWVDATATLLTENSDIEYAHQCLVKKYGWQMKTINFFSRLSGKIEQRSFFKIQFPS